jgi:isoaspartyl peptidase/L-asparaginase-like protein (Ntn-hydrolase superfamily)
MIMRVGMARIVALYVELGDNLEIACDKAMTKLAAIGGRGGIIAISHKGGSYTSTIHGQWILLWRCGVASNNHFR